MQQYSNKYIFLFTAAVCVVCSLMISVAAVGLKSRQELNQQLKKQRNVLQACGILQPGQKMNAAEVDKAFEAIEVKHIDLATGDYIDEASYTPDAVTVPDKNLAQIFEVPQQVELYVLKEEGIVVLPIYGKGLWSTLYGFLALGPDGNTIKGITYYKHGETPGLGGEVDNQKWKDKWPGRKAYDGDGNVAIKLIKGSAGTAEDNPHKVDGLSGATLTSRGVTNMLDFWLSDTGYGPYLGKFRAQ